MIRKPFDRDLHQGYVPVEWDAGNGMTMMQEGGGRFKWDSQKRAWYVDFDESNGQMISPKDIKYIPASERPEWDIFIPLEKKNYEIGTVEPMNYGTGFTDPEYREGQDIGNMNSSNLMNNLSVSFSTVNVPPPQDKISWTGGGSSFRREIPPVATPSYVSNSLFGDYRDHVVLNNSFVVPPQRFDTTIPGTVSNPAPAPTLSPVILPNLIPFSQGHRIKKMKINKMKIDKKCNHRIKKGIY